MTIQQFRQLLRGLAPAELAALLHELGFELYRRELTRWRVVTDLADELLDQQMAAARRRLAQALPQRRPSSRSRSAAKRRRSA